MKLDKHLTRLTLCAGFTLITGAGVLFAPESARPMCLLAMILNATATFVVFASGQEPV